MSEERRNYGDRDTGSRKCGLLPVFSFVPKEVTNDRVINTVINSWAQTLRPE